MAPPAVPLPTFLPRLFDDVAATLQQTHPQLLEQLRTLRVVARCQCGTPGCVSLVCESSDKRYAPVNGQQPLSFPIQGIHGWYAVSASGVLSGFEVLDDYSDQAIAQQLQSFGFEAGEPLPPQAPDDTHEDGSATSVYMTAAATAHLIAYRSGLQAFSPEAMADYMEAAMRADAEAVETRVNGTAHLSLLSTTITDPGTQRELRARLLLRRRKAGFEVRNMVPEGILPQTL